MRLIANRADIEAGLAGLLVLEPRFAQALAVVEEVPLRRKAGGFGDLLDAIISQQVSVASAAAIAARMRAAGLWEGTAIAAASDEDLRAVGLSRPKMRYVRALAGAALDYGALAVLSDSEVVARLTAIAGIGRWSAEVYLLQSLGRADVFPAGDLALQESARVLFGMQARPSEREMRALAAGWAPQRAIAARLLWAYYGGMKKREGIR
ncbi:MAG TPA: DNA-3-methyladenine glycosylase 2 family protein [Aliiroseovarius sp.]|nr:DNA-3-methyladenine glycosylase 2 family protein [Aliiroseovarius sp.]